MTIEFKTTPTILSFRISAVLYCSHVVYNFLFYDDKDITWHILWVVNDTVKTCGNSKIQYYLILTINWRTDRLCKFEDRSFDNCYITCQRNDIRRYIFMGILCLSHFTWRCERCTFVSRYWINYFIGMLKAC